MKYFCIVKGQLVNVRCKVKSNPTFFKQYDSIIQDYVKRDFIESVEQLHVEGHYLPHHPIFEESRTTSMRIVFNASSKPSWGGGGIIE